MVMTAGTNAEVRADKEALDKLTAELDAKEVALLTKVRCPQPEHRETHNREAHNLSREAGAPASLLRSWASHATPHARNWNTDTRTPNPNYKPFTTNSEVSTPNR